MEFLSLWVFFPASVFPFEPKLHYLRFKLSMCPDFTWCDGTFIVHLEWTPAAATRRGTAHGIVQKCSGSQTRCTTAALPFLITGSTKGQRKHECDISHTANKFGFKDTGRKSKPCPPYHSWNFSFPMRKSTRTALKFKLI